MEAWQGFAGAVIGGLIVGLWNLFLQNRQHEHAVTMQKLRWDREDKELKEQRRYDCGERIREWDNARTDRKAEWEHQRREREIQIEEDRRLEHERDQRDTLRELQIAMPVLGRAARTLYEEQRSAYLEIKKSGGSGGKEFVPSESFREYGRQYNDLDQKFITLLSRVENEKIRIAGSMLYQLDRQMALLWPSTWDSKSLYGGRTPTYLAIDREQQLTRMIGKVLRGQSIEDEAIEEFAHRDPDD